VADAQQFHRLGQVHPSFGGGQALAAEVQVGLYAEVGKEAGFLEDVTQGAAVGG